MDEHPHRHQLNALGLLMLLLGGIGYAWELWARQSSGSSLYLGALPGPIHQFASTAGFLGILCWASAGASGHIKSGLRATAIVTLIALGAFLLIGTDFYGATQGLHGIQVDDPRPDARWMVRIKALGFLLLFTSGLMFGWSLWRRERKRD